MSDLIRLAHCELCGLKNVEYGCIELPNANSIEKRAAIEKSDIIGIYGQNGSGKTAMIEALDIAKILMMGKCISFDEYGGIISPSGSSLDLTYLVVLNGKTYKVSYSFELQAKEKERIIAPISESITIWGRGKGWIQKRFIKVCNQYYDSNGTIFGYKDNLTSFDGFKNEEELTSLPFISLSDRVCMFSASKGGLSYFFNDQSLSSLESFEPFSDEIKELKSILLFISNYACASMFVIKVDQLGEINDRIWLPLNISNREDGKTIAGLTHIPLKTFGTTQIPKNLLERVEKTIDSINYALTAIVPGLKILLQTTSEEIDIDGNVFDNVQLMSERDGRLFPTRFESEGIKRIISILSCLVSVYNNPMTCLAVDELDSGVFEYLLGEILGIMSTEAKGQLIFTSHNLRAFEMLDNYNIVCSTTNPKNRYVKLTGVQQNNNKRDFYIRALSLGGQKECLYDGDDLENIGYAFRKAGHME